MLAQKFYFLVGCNCHIPRHQRLKKDISKMCFSLSVHRFIAANCFSFSLSNINIENMLCLYVFNSSLCLGYSLSLKHTQNIIFLHLFITSFVCLFSLTNTPIHTHKMCLFSLCFLLSLFLFSASSFISWIRLLSLFKRILCLYFIQLCFLSFFHCMRDSHQYLSRRSMFLSMCSRMSKSLTLKITNCVPNLIW